jgi:hypothetical protein
MDELLPPSEILIACRILGLSPEQVTIESIEKAFDQNLRTAELESFISRGDGLDKEFVCTGENLDQEVLLFYQTAKERLLDWLRGRDK